MRFYVKQTILAIPVLIGFAGIAAAGTHVYQHRPITVPPPKIMAADAVCLHAGKIDAAREIVMCGLPMASCIDEQKAILKTPGFHAECRK
jgi:hypothetical protein